MSDAAPRYPWKNAAVWVFHAGALGDFVLTWPLLRALARQGAGLTVVAAGSKAALASRELGVTGVDAEQRRFVRLWAGEAEGSPITGVGHVLTFVADDTGAPAAAWRAGAARFFPGAVIRSVGPPGSPSRAALWHDAGVPQHGDVQPRDNPGGPAVLHVGAGSNEKRWPLERWIELAARLRAGGVPVRLLAGEVEAERFTPAERGAFDAAGGRFVWDLIELAGLLRDARVFVGADTGPTHLAAQLGVRTVALFGPTDPGVWGPVGPKVVTCRAPLPGDMGSLDVCGVANVMGTLAADATP